MGRVKSRVEELYTLHVCIDASFCFAFVSRQCYATPIAKEFTSLFFFMRVCFIVDAYPFCLKYRHDESGAVNSQKHALVHVTDNDHTSVQVMHELTR